jgi:hypothetical protein
MPRSSEEIIVTDDIPWMDRNLDDELGPAEVARMQGRVASLVAARRRRRRAAGGAVAIVTVALVCGAVASRPGDGGDLATTQGPSTSAETPGSPRIFVPHEELRRTCGSPVAANEPSGVTAILDLGPGPVDESTTGQVVVTNDRAEPVRISQGPAISVLVVRNGIIDSVDAGPSAGLAKVVVVQPGQRVTLPVEVGLEPCSAGMPVTTTNGLAAVLPIAVGGSDAWTLLRSDIVDLPTG